MAERGTPNGDPAGSDQQVLATATLGVKPARFGQPRPSGSARQVLVRWTSVLFLAVGAVLAVRALPVGTLLARFQSAVDGTGAAGMAAFGAAYVLSTLLFMPGSALTLLAGAVFGPLRGTLVVSLASTTAAAVAFLAARHLGRARVLALAGRHRVFRAVDRAIAEGGWKVVGLLRLSPAMPFSAGNYLFGLTAVRFWPYVLASWAFMLPGTLLYAAIGHAGRATVSGSRSVEEWALLAAGLAATAGVTFSVTRRARRALEEQHVMAETALDAPPRGPASSRSAGILPVGGVLVLGLGLWAHAHERWFRWDEAGQTVHLTELYRWYGGDFEQEAGSVLGFVARYAPPVRGPLSVGRRPHVRWIPYDWSLNGKEMVP